MLCQLAYWDAVGERLVEVRPVLGGFEKRVWVMLAAQSAAAGRVIVCWDADNVSMSDSSSDEEPEEVIRAPIMWAVVQEREKCGA